MVFHPTIVLPPLSIFVMHAYPLRLGSTFPQTSYVPCLTLSPPCSCPWVDKSLVCQPLHCWHTWAFGPGRFFVDGVGLVPQDISEHLCSLPMRCQELSMSGFNSQKCPLANAPGRVGKPQPPAETQWVTVTPFSAFTMEWQTFPSSSFKVTASTISLLLVNFKTMKCISVPLLCLAFRRVLGSVYTASSFLCSPNFFWLLSLPVCMKR